MCGVSVLTIQRLESSQLQPHLTQFRTLSTATNTPIQKLLGIPDWLDEKNIWDTFDNIASSGMSTDEIEEWLDDLEDIYSVSELIADIGLYQKVSSYVLDSLPSFTPEGLLRLVESINELKKVPDYQRSALDSDTEAE